MNAERYAQVKQIFQAACELEADQQDAFLVTRCAGDTELRREVESLLRHNVSRTYSVPELASALNTGQRQAERFPVGTIVAGRYRILGKLGQGGMGEVFRADDLELEQSVAVKFLTRELTANAKALQRFRNEVRLARKVTHPNIVRVHDLGEAAGEVFLSMEYVDGENLDSLLKRIGRLPREKTIETARQICAGLGAAHDQGVLHRDLKPQNVMIDAEGRVRITDFGIAALTADAESGIPLAGTPPYMAPELWNGTPASVRSDLYSLGLVLFELATGRLPYQGASSKLHHELAPPVSPSVLVPEIDPALERVILQCLQLDPARRPQSAYEVIAALPGGGPWAEIVAAGGTPSPDMIAAGSAEAVFPARGTWTLCGLVLASLIGIMLLADRTLFLSQTCPVKPPAVLADRAEQIIQALGHDLTGPSMGGFSVDPDFLDAAVYSDQPGAGLPPGQSPARRLSPAICYWYRRGTVRLPGPIPLGETTLVHEPLVEAGTILARIDTEGKLREFVAPPAGKLGDSRSQPPDWPAVFRLAGLEPADFQETEPRAPPVFADVIFAWTSRSTDATQAVRVDGAARNGQVVYFQVHFPWEHGNSDDIDVIPSSPAISWTFAVRFFLYLGFLAVAVALASRNLSSGRGDRDGAGRLALFVTALSLAEWLVAKRHSPVLSEEATSMFLWLARATLVGSAMWVCYVAVEPYVRRYWPESIVSWSCLLKGRWRDRLVCRDVLAGAAFGAAMVLLLQCDALLPAQLGLAAHSALLPDAGGNLDELLGLRFKLGAVIDAVLRSITTGLLLLLAMLVFRATLRQAQISTAAYGLFLTGLFWFLRDGGFLPWLTGAVLAAAVVAVLTRLGLTALIAGLFVRSLLLSGPITRHWELWYAPTGNCVLVIIAAIAVWGAWGAAPPARTRG